MVFPNHSLRIVPALVACLGLGLTPHQSAQVQRADPVDSVLIANGTNGFPVTLGSFDQFGFSLANLGDLDGNGFSELFVGAPFDDADPPPTDQTYSANFGAGYVLFRDAEGQVINTQKISNLEGGLVRAPRRGDRFGRSAAAIGDLDGDGLPELAVGAPYRDAPTPDSGQVWILFFNSDGTVRDEQVIGANFGGFGGRIDAGDLFGWGVGPIGDLNSDGVPDMAVGAGSDDDGFANAGALWILFMNSDGSVQSHQKISATEGGLGSPPGIGFGRAITVIDDLDGDGIGEVAVTRCNDATIALGGDLNILYLASNGTVRTSFKIRSDDLNDLGGLSLVQIGRSLSTVDTVLAPQGTTLALGANSDYFPGSSGYVLLLEIAGFNDYSIQSVLDPLDPVLDAFGRFGSAMTVVNDGVWPRLVVGSSSYDLTGLEHGAVSQIRLCSGDPLAAFDVTPEVASVGEPFFFQDLSLGSGNYAWEWDFGDGQIATLQNPSHTYAATGTYDVKLRVFGTTGGCGITERNATITVVSAAVSTRNGTGGNPDILRSQTTPILGASWTASVDAGSVGLGGVAVIYGFEGPLAGFPTVFGELLMDPSTPLVFTEIAALVAGVADFEKDVPSDIGLAGFSLTTQTIVFNGGGVMTNALDLVLGL